MNLNKYDGRIYKQKFFVIIMPTRIDDLLKDDSFQVGIKNFCKDNNPNSYGVLYTQITILGNRDTNSEMGRITKALEITKNSCSRKSDANKCLNSRKFSPLNNWYKIGCSNDSILKYGKGIENLNEKIRKYKEPEAW